MRADNIRPYKIAKTIEMLRLGIICFLALQTVCTNWVQRHAAGGSPILNCTKYDKVTLGKYNCLYIKLSARTGYGGLPCGRIISAPTKLRKQLKCYARVIMFELLQTICTNWVQRHAAGGSPLSGGKNYSNVTLGKYNCLYIKLSARIGNGGLPCGRIICIV